MKRNHVYSFETWFILERAEFNNKFKFLNKLGATRIIRNIFKEVEGYSTGDRFNDYELVFIPDEETDNKVRLETLYVDKDKRGKGIATKVMNKVIDAADEYGITLDLTIDSEAASRDIKNVEADPKNIGMTDSQLKKFYSKFGFDFDNTDFYGIRYSDADLKKEREMFIKYDPKLHKEENIKSFSDPMTFWQEFSSGVMEPGLYEIGDDTLVQVFDDGKAKKVDGVKARYDFKTNSYQLVKTATKHAA